jgi:disulfide bond formation protein DsbB
MDRRIAVLAALGSAALLAGAYGFEHGLGLAPCALCLWQRWPHWAAVALGAVALIRAAPLVALAGAGAALTTAGIGIYHTGVERGWWPGPTACSGALDPAGLSAEQLLERILAAPAVRCDEVAWQFLGLSMASWNALASLALAAVWLRALRPRTAGG